jgi:molybdenum cofactor guanylyltransferase
MVVRVAGLLAEAVGEVVVVTRRPSELAGLGLTVVEDDPGPQTPLSGIRTGLRLAGDRPAFVAACDMPFLAPAFVRALLELGPPNEASDAVVPLSEGRPQPLHAVWLPAALPAIEAAIASDAPSPKRLLRSLAVRWVEEPEWRLWDPGGRSLTNLNTPEDLTRERARRSSMEGQEI